MCAVLYSGATITTGLNPQDPHEKHITKIDLSSQDIEGVMPYSIFKLHRLTSLDVSHNRLSGPIPASLGHMAGLKELRLQHNFLIGTIPFALGGLPSMHHPYTGIVIEEPKSLTELDSDNDDDALLDEKPHVRFDDRTPEEKQLSAVMDKRTEVSEGFRYSETMFLLVPNVRCCSMRADSCFLCRGCASLTHLDCSHNWIGGSIPTNLNKLVRLQQLMLTRNRFTGDIPVSICAISGLELLLLDDNLLSGRKSAHFWVLISLTMFVFNAEVIPELGQLAKLKMLFLNSNKFTGSVPHTLTNMRALKSLWLHDNELEDGKLNAAKTLALRFRPEQNCQVFM
jgi:Leucine-rich repeat (LRR) protein